jgi:hypothetical protein
MKLCAFFVPLLRNDRSRSRQECVARRPIIVPIRLAGALGMVATTGALPVIALAVMEFGPAFGVKTSPMEKRPHAKSFLHSSSTMATRLGHIAKIISIPNFNYAGAASGPHSRFGSVCTIDFANSYIERAK